MNEKEINDLITIINSMDGLPEIKYNGGSILEVIKRIQFTDIGHLVNVDKEFIGISKTKIENEKNENLDKLIEDYLNDGNNI